MSETSTVGRRIVGAVVGLLTGAALGALAAFLFCRYNESEDYLGPIVFAGLIILAGGTAGAAGGATLAQRLSKKMSSFCEALMGAMIGLLVGWLGARMSTGLPSLVSTDWTALVIMPISIVAGAVLGSGWEDKPGDLTGFSS